MADPVRRDRPARQVYLEIIGLTDRDPFSAPIAEQELAYAMESQTVTGDPEAGSKPPHSFRYFSLPPMSALPSEQTISQVLRVLREPRPAFLYGSVGAGKTTLRLALEASFRREPDHTLVISYPLADDIPKPFSPEAHWDRLARALAVDLLIQVVEQFNPLDPAPGPNQIDALRAQIRIGGKPLKRLVKRILDEPEPQVLVGMGLLWRSVDRFAVRRVVRSPALISLLQASLSGHTPDQSEPKGTAAIVAGLQASHLWGFDKACALVDGVDIHQRDQDFMLDLIQPLLNALPDWDPHHLTFKFFLPLELQVPVSASIERIAPRLTSQPFESIIGPWDNKSLQRLLAARFRAGGSRRVGFNDLRGPGLEDKSLDGLLIEAAQGSPRRLLQIVSRLIDAHSVRDPHDRRISLADWNRALRAHVTDPPAAFSPTGT